MTKKQLILVTNHNICLLHGKKQLDVLLVMLNLLGGTDDSEFAVGVGLVLYNSKKLHDFRPPD